MATPWQQQIDNTHVVRSGVASKYPNGSKELEAHLVRVHDHDGHVVGKLAPAAARSWDAMVAHAWRDSVDLRPTSAGDTFRTRASQDRLWDTRYDHTDHGNGGRTCGGDHRFLKDGEATAACPGTSKHGEAGAVDFRRSKGKPELRWMEGHAKAYGWAWELSSEEWHVHYMLGDQVTAAVLEHERTTPAPPKSEEDDMYDPKLDQDIDHRLAVLPQGGMFDFDGDGGDRSLVWLEAPSHGEQGPAVLVQRVAAAGAYERRVLKQGCVAGALAGPFVDGRRIDCVVQLQDGGVSYVTFDPNDPGPLPGRWHAVDKP